ncbi:reverse transcriptase domain-containing protein [Pseudoscourfieldia marina]
MGEHSEALTSPTSEAPPPPHPSIAEMPYLSERHMGMPAPDDCTSLHPECLSRATSFLTARNAPSLGNPFAQLNDHELAQCVPCPFDGEHVTSADVSSTLTFESYHRHDRRRLLAVANEIAQFHPMQHLPRWKDLPLRAAFSDRAAVVKRLLLELRHASGRTRVDTRFFRRLTVERRRHRGVKRWYVVVADAANERDLLVLHVPDSLHGDNGHTHAMSQATFGSDLFDRHIAGHRLNVKELLQYPMPLRDMQCLVWGHRAELAYIPEGKRVHNYPTCWDPVLLEPGEPPQPGRHAHEFDKWRERYLEGPLLYTPRWLTPMGGLYKPRKDKYRIVADATRTGVNRAHHKTAVRLDSIDDVLRDSFENGWQAGIDLTECFLLYAQSALDADLFTLHDTAERGFFRARYYLFGGTQAPTIAQRWALTFKRILQQHALSFCKRRHCSKDFRVVGAYLDDFKISIASHVEYEDALDMLDGVLTLLRRAGVDVNPTKVDLPSKRQEYCGVVIDTERRHITISDQRRADYSDTIRACLENSDDKITRLQLASIAGKLQWTTMVLPGGQARLTAMYRSLYDIIENIPWWDYALSWSDMAHVRITPQIRQDLHWWLEALNHGHLTRAFYPGTGLWKGGIDVPADVEELQLCTLPSDPSVHVITTDAAGIGGGGWYGPHRFQHKYDGNSRPTSNFRELDTAVRALELWAPCLAGVQSNPTRVLLRTDNTTTMAVFNKRASAVEAYQALIQRLNAVIDKYHLDVAAQHIRGVDNQLADQLSRQFTPSFERDDWCMRQDVFEWVENTFGEFDVDACAHPLGNNAMCPRFWSIVEPCTAQSWRHRRVWCNPPYRADIISEILQHAWAEHFASPADTSAVFVLPAWTTASWWRALKGQQVIAVYPAGAQLFTTPPRSAREGDFRQVRRSTQWPVVLTHIPPRSARHASLHTHGARNITPHRNMPVLSGDAHRDTLLLSALSEEFLRPHGVSWMEPPSAWHAHRVRRVHRVATRGA